MWAKIIGILSAVLILAGASVGQASTMYICNSDDSGVSHLYTLTPAGQATKAGSILKDGTSNLDIRDIAYDPKTGVMYAITISSLYTLNFLHPTGDVVTATLVGSGTGVSSLQGLTVALDGTIYAGSKPSGQVGSLYNLDSGGVAHSVGSFGSGGGETGDYLRDYGDLAFSNNGILYGMFVWNNQSANNYLATVSTGNGAATPVGGTSKNNVDGLTFMNGTLYSCSPNKLYTLNSSTGQVLSDTTI
jgi:hypothetical protein